MGLIFYSSSIESIHLPRIPSGFDKVLHICIYAILAFLSYLSFKNSGVRKYVFLLSFVFATIYGIADEFHQLYVPGRAASLGDTVADSFGAFLGSYLASGRWIKRCKEQIFQARAIVVYKVCAWLKISD